MTISMWNASCAVCMTVRLNETFHNAAIEPLWAPLEFMMSIFLIKVEGDRVTHYLSEKQNRIHRWARSWTLLLSRIL